MMPSEPPPTIKIGASILAADLNRLGDEIHAAEQAGVDYIHIDVMDGRFVRPITMGQVFIEAARRSTALPLDVHLMVANPSRQIEPTAAAGADMITVHVEATEDLSADLEQIRATGARPGLALNPGTDVSRIEDAISLSERVLAMTVEPGYAGQPFRHEVLPKVRRLRALMDERGYGAELAVDGGVDHETAPLAASAGADVLVAATAIFRSGTSVGEAVARIRAQVVVASEARE